MKVCVGCLEQSLTIFLMAALEWFAAVEISSSASATNINIHKHRHINPEFKMIKSV